MTKKHSYWPILAILILLIGIGATLFVNAEKTDTVHITINGGKYSVEQLFQMGEEKTIGEESGIALDNLMEVIGVPNPETREYTIIGADGYQKTVNWENMSGGILTKNRESIFADLPKAFNIKEIVEIKVE